MAEGRRLRDGSPVRSTLQQSLALLYQAVARYEDMIVKDPDFTSKLETVLRVASYIIPGRFGGSWELSELAYSVSNLYSLGNDYIIAKKCPAACKISNCSRHQQSLLWCLSLLDTVEVAVEMLTQRFAGEPSKWGVVILMQVTRALLRCLLVFKYDHGLLCTPSVPAPDRKKAAQAVHAKPVDGEGKPLAWKAPRTGKVIRSIHADDSVPYSQLHQYVDPPSPPARQSAASSAESAPQRMALRNKQLSAEALYIARPLVHIVSMFLFSQQSWKPWLLSLTMEVASLQLLGATTSYPNSQERSEIMRRRVALLLYLLRSPFYDRHSKSTVISLLKTLSEKLPLAHFILGPLLEYLPVWQQTYSYNWLT